VSEGARAELIEDRGEAAAGEEFFRSRSFFDAEGVTHTLRITGAGPELLAPLIVKEIDGGPQLDATSPYGYPGFGVSTAASDIDHTRAGSMSDARKAAAATPPLDPATIDFTATGLVAAFIRHTLSGAPLASASERNTVQIADPTLPAKSRGSDRNQINKNLRNGYRLSLVPGPETGPAQRTGFLAAYEQTMRRTGAAARYFFGADYFDRILEFPRSWLVLAEAPEGTIAAASIAASSDGYLHYYLSGSADSHLRDSPMKNVVASLVELATELGEPLNLGGGISRGDRLEEFKRGFANRALPWCTSELIADPAAYARLSAGRDPGSFFPAYRA
jgi:hypothetical protein